VSGEPPLIFLPEYTRPLLEATRTVLATPNLPPVVLIGGVAVTMRVSAAGTAHRRLSRRDAEYAGAEAA
jgi:hypothetical protein